MEKVEMKNKSLALLIAGILVLSACAPAVAEEAAAPEVMKEEAALAEEPAVEEATPVEAAPATTDAMAAEISFSADIWPVIEQFALAAHGGKGGVFLESYEDILQYVVPGSPEESVLYKRLTGDGVPVMPPSGMLPDETIQLFYDWISQGAKNN